MGLTIHIDGGSRGNPGPAAAGIVIHDDRGRPVLEAGYFLGRKTNNQAEYHALLLALEAAANYGEDEITIKSDSELLVRQLLGEYQVRSAELASLFQQVQRRLLTFGAWQIRHLRREQNRRADSLANLALDAGADVVQVELGKISPRRAQRSPSKPAGTRILARVTDGPEGAVCPSGCRLGDEFEFGQTLPAGLCVHVAGPLLEAVRKLQAEPDRPCPPLQVRCEHEGCGLVFTLERAPD